MNVYKLYFDGSCNPNPGGVASFGYTIYLNDKELNRGYGIIGHGANMTDVVAETYALSQGLSVFVKLWDRPNATLEIYGDSLYIIAKLQKYEFTKFPEAQIIKHKIEQILDSGIGIKIHWIPREENKLCDSLAKFFRESL